MAMAWMAKDWPRSTCTHCVPFLNSTASSSTASFLPSVIRLNSPKYGATLLVTVLPAATFVTPLGTSMDGGATSEGGSMFGPTGKSAGVPLSVWRGRSSFSGSVALASCARTADAIQATVNATINRDLNKLFFKPLSLPAFAVVSLHKLRGCGLVRGAHVGPVPFQLAAYPGSQGDTAKQYDLGEISCDVEVRVSRRTPLHRREPFLVVAGRARNGLGHRHASFMFVASHVFLFVLENDLETRAVVIAREQFALLADDEAPAGGEFSSLRDNFIRQVCAGPQRRDEFHL